MQKSEKKEHKEAYLWRRIFARILDYQIAGGLLAILFFFPLKDWSMVEWIYSVIYASDNDLLRLNLLWFSFNALFWMPIEGCLLYAFGTTPGKALINLKITCNRCKLSYFGRSFYVFFLCMGLGIPIIQQILNLNALYDLKRHRIAFWDRWTHCIVELQSTSKIKTSFAKVLILILRFCLVILFILIIRIGNAMLETQIFRSLCLNTGFYDVAQIECTSRLNTFALYPNAAPLLQKMAERGIVNAQFKLGINYAAGKDVIQSYQKAFQWFEKAAIHGNALAQYNLGIMYSNGNGVIKSDKEAFHWYKKAAIQGHAWSQYNLGTMYQEGIGVAKNYQLAFQWLTKSAIQGNAKSQYNLGIMYESGKGVLKNTSEAFRWFEKSAIQRDKYAQYNLGSMYESGIGVVANHQQAFQWYKKSAIQGFARAQFNLGSMYISGKGVKKNIQMAFQWIEKAALQGSIRAQHNLGVMYYQGDGVLKDTVKAHMWWNISSTSNDEAISSDEAIKLIEKEMTLEQISRARLMANEWKRKNP